MKKKELVIKLKADIKDYKAKLEIATGKIKDLEKGIEKVEKTGKSGFGKLTASVASFSMAANGVISGLRAIAGKTAEFINLSNIQEKSEKRLEIALRNSGDATRKTFEAQKHFAASIQETTTVGDEQVMILQSMALTMGATSDNVGDVTKNAISLSKAFDIDMNTALRASVSALDDNYEMLTRYIPKLRSAGSEAEKTAIYQQAVTDGWKVATGELESGYGALEDFDNSIGDLKEDIGDLLKIAILPFIGILKDIVAGISSFKDSLTPLESEFDKITKSTYQSDLHFKTLEQTYISLAKKTNKTATEIDVLNDTYKELQKTYPVYFGNLKNEKENYEKIVIALKDVQKEIDNKAQAQIKEAILQDKQAEINKLHKEGIRLLKAKMEAQVLFDTLMAKQVKRSSELRKLAKAGVTPAYDNTWHEMDRALTGYNYNLHKLNDDIKENEELQLKVQKQVKSAMAAYNAYFKVGETGFNKVNQQAKEFTNNIKQVQLTMEDEDDTEGPETQKDEDFIDYQPEIDAENAKNEALSLIAEEYNLSKREGRSLEIEELMLWYDDKYVLSLLIM